MKLTATEFRKNPFSVLEEVVPGNSVEVSYKGSSVRPLACRRSPSWRGRSASTYSYAIPMRSSRAIRNSWPGWKQSGTRTGKCFERLSGHPCRRLAVRRASRSSVPGSVAGDRANDLLISPIVLLELEYLHKRKRISRQAVDVSQYLSSAFGVGICHYPFPAVTLESVGLDWTCDPFDRMIVAQARANDNAVLITADAFIRRHYKRAIW